MQWLATLFVDLGRHLSDGDSVGGSQNRYRLLSLTVNANVHWQIACNLNERRAFSSVCVITLRIGVGFGNSDNRTPGAKTSRQERPFAT